MTDCYVPLYFGVWQSYDNAGQPTGQVTPNLYVDTSGLGQAYPGGTGVCPQTVVFEHSLDSGATWTAISAPIDVSQGGFFTADDFLTVPTTPDPYYRATVAGSAGPLSFGTYDPYAGVSQPYQQVQVRFNNTPVNIDVSARITRWSSPEVELTARVLSPATAHQFLPDGPLSVDAEVVFPGNTFSGVDLSGLPAEVTFIFDPWASRTSVTVGGLTASETLDSLVAKLNGDAGFAAQGTAVVVHPRADPADDGYETSADGFAVVSHSPGFAALDGDLTTILGPGVSSSGQVVYRHGAVATLQVDADHLDIDQVVTVDTAALPEMTNRATLRFLTTFTAPGADYNPYTDFYLAGIDLTAPRTNLSFTVSAVGPFMVVHAELGLPDPSENILIPITVRFNPGDGSYQPFWWTPDQAPTAPQGFDYQDPFSPQYTVGQSLLYAVGGQFPNTFVNLPPLAVTAPLLPRPDVSTAAFCALREEPHGDAVRTLVADYFIAQPRGAHDHTPDSAVLLLTGNDGSSTEVPITDLTPGVVHRIEDPLGASFDHSVQYTATLVTTTTAAIDETQPVSSPSSMFTPINSTPEQSVVASPWTTSASYDPASGDVTVTLVQTFDGAGHSTNLASWGLTGYRLDAPALNGQSIGSRSDLNGQSGTYTLADSGRGPGAPMLYVSTTATGGDRLLFFATPPAPTWTTTDLPAAPSGAAYDVQLAVTGPGPITVAPSDGTVPSWLTVGADGHLTGTPQDSDAGTASFTLRATNPNGSTDQAFTLAVTRVEVKPATPTLTVAYADDGVSAQLSATFYDPAAPPSPLPTSCRFQISAASAGVWTTSAGGGNPSGIGATRGATVGVPDPTLAWDFRVQSSTGQNLGNPNFVDSGDVGDLSDWSAVATLAPQPPSDVPPTVTLTPTWEQDLWGPTGAVVVAATIDLASGTPPFTVEISADLGGCQFRGTPPPDPSGWASFTAVEGGVPNGATTTLVVHLIDNSGVEYASPSVTFTAPDAGRAPTYDPDGLDGFSNVQIPVGVPFGVSIAHATGDAPITYTAGPGSRLPDGVTLDPDGTLHGTASSYTGYPFTLVATNAAGSTALPLSIYLAPPPLPAGVTVTAAARFGAVDLTLHIPAAGPYETQPTTVSVFLDNQGDQEWSLVDQALSGPGDYPLTLPVTNPTNADAQLGINFSAFVGGQLRSVGSINQALTLVLTDPGNPPTITNDPPPNGTAGQAYPGFQFTASGGAPITWTTDDALPSGMSLTGAGLLAGTPTGSGSFLFTVRATNDAGSATVVYSLFIAAASGGTTTPAPVITNGQPTAAVVGTPYSFRYTATDPSQVTGARWATSVGSLPPGLSLDAATGIVSGTPTAAGSFLWTERYHNDTAATAVEQQLTLTVVAAVQAVQITSQGSAFPGAVVGTAYSTAVTANRPQSGLTWSVSAGSLPAGLALVSENGSEYLRGTPTAPGVTSFTLHVADGNGTQDSHQFTIVVTAAPVPLAITNGQPPSARVAVPYRFSFQVTETASGRKWSITDGVLPPGLALDPINGTISGTPTAEGSYAFTQRYTSPVTGAQTQQAMTLTVAAAAAPAPGAPRIVSGAPPNGSVGQPYDFLFVVSGTEPVTVSITGALPPGLTLTGRQLSGTLQPQNG